MFDHFGIKDVFFTLWHKKLKCIGCAIILSILCAVVLFSLSTNANSSDIKKTGNVYGVSSIIYFDVVDESANDKNNILKQGAMSYNSALSLESTRDYLLNELLKKYTLEELKTIVGVKPDSLELITFFEKTYDYSVINEGITVNVHIESYDKEFADDLSDAINSYISNVAAKNINFVTPRITTGISKIVVPSIITQNVMIVPKKAIILVSIIIGIAFTIIIICIDKLFRPTMNFETDFVSYDLRIIGRIK